MFPLLGDCRARSSTIYTFILSFRGKPQEREGAAGEGGTGSIMSGSQCLVDDGRPGVLSTLDLVRST